MDYIFINRSLLWSVYPVLWNGLKNFKVLIMIQNNTYLFSASYVSGLPLSL